MKNGKLIRLFKEHPASVNETYLEHQKEALTVGFRMIGAGICCVIHALLPFLFTTTASRTIVSIHRSIEKRMNRLNKLEP